MTMDATRLAVALSHANVGAVLRVLREGESRQSDDAYTLINGGAHFASFDAHPFGELPTTRGGRASGAYQFLPTTWADLRRRYPWALPDFSPPSQDAGAVLLIHDRGALDDVMAGRIEAAISKLRPTWTSLPGASENSGRYTMARALGVYRQYGGRLAADQSDTQPAAPIEDRSVPYQPTEEVAMAPVLMFLPAILEMIPALMGLFGKGEKGERNTKAAQIVVDTFTKAVPGAVNAQQAVEMAQADPAVRAAAAAAVISHPVIESMLTIGPTGIKEAREANTALVASADRWWKLVLNPVLLVTMMVLPLVYIIVVKLVEHMSKVSSDVIAQTIGTVIGLVLGGIMGFWMGQTYQQNNRRSNDQQSGINALTRQE